MNTQKSYFLPAEWAPQSIVQLTFPHENTDWAEVLPEVLPCFIEIAETISRFQQVLIVCNNSSDVRAYLKHANQNNLLFCEAPTNDTWARDHGGITILQHRQGKSPEALVLDFVFNGWGLKFPAYHDNLITSRLKSIGVLRTLTRPGGLVLEGGGIESDGEGTLLTTSACLLSPNRNPHLSKKQIEKKLKQIFGLDRVLWLDHGYLAGDDTDSHIDTLARFCNPHTIAYVKCTDNNDEHFEALKLMEEQLKTFRMANGKPYNLVALPWPDACYAPDGHRLPATYANFLIINGAVLIPTYRVSQDEEALHIFRHIFPDREVIGIDCRALILQHGSLHCLTMQYPVEVQWAQN